MKWKESDFKNNIDKAHAVLVFGPDAGQVDELCDYAIKKLNIERDNLFALDCDEMSDKQDTLFAESCTPSMFGGHKMVIVSNAGDSDAKIISELVNHSGLCATVLICAGELRAGGGLRTLFEDSSELAAMACYTDDARSLATLIRSELSADAGIAQITPDAMEYMTTHLGGDRAITRGFLSKIALYVNDKKIVELEDVEKCLPDTGAADTDDFLYSLTAGHIQQTVLALDRLLYENTDANKLVRMLDSHFKKLLTAVVDGQLPRLFWKVAEKFNRAVAIWPESEIISVLTRLNELEAQLRTPGIPPEILIRDFALKLSLRAAKLAIKGKK